MTSFFPDHPTMRYGLLPQPPTAYLIQPPHGQHESSFLPTMVEFPFSLPTTVPACEVVLSTLPPMPQPLPHWPAAGPSIALPPVPYHPALATYRFPANASDEQIDRELSYKSGDKLPPLGQKSLLLPPLPSILAPRRSSAGLFAQETMAKGAGRGGKKKAKHSCKLCCISFTRAHDLKRHNTIHKTEKAFPCPHCSKRFGRRDALKRHLEVRGPAHNDFTKKASAGQPRKPRPQPLVLDAISSTISPTPSGFESLQTWDDCGSSDIHLGSEEPSAVSSPLIEVPADFGWLTSVPSAPATHLDYDKLLGGGQFWEQLLS